MKTQELHFTNDEMIKLDFTEFKDGSFSLPDGCDVMITITDEGTEKGDVEWFAYCDTQENPGQYTELVYERDVINLEDDYEYGILEDWFAMAQAINPWKKS